MLELAGEGDYIKSLAGDLILGSIFKALEGTAKATNQANILMARQGNNYVPFLSGAVNQAIGNLTASQKPLFDLIKLLYETNGNAQNTTNPTQNNYYLTPDEAIKMAGNNTESLLNNNSLLEAKYAELKEHGLPNIDARDEENSQRLLPDSTNSGQKYIQKMAVKHPKLVIKNTKKADNHSNRRVDNDEISDAEMAD
jgi:hypothetical protein